MKKLILAALIAASPLLASAVDVNVNLGNVRIDAPGVTVTFGSRNDRGYYWDGYDWREPRYWQEHQGPRGPKYYTGHGKGRGYDDDGDRHCPPGQAKKGRC